MKKIHLLILSILLLAGITFSIIQIINAAAPSPGHTAAQIEPGSAGQVLTTSGGVATWQAPTSPTYYTRTKSGSGTITCDSGDTMTGGGAICTATGGNDPGCKSYPSGENGWYCYAYFFGDYIETCYVRCVHY